MGVMGPAVERVGVLLPKLSPSPKWGLMLAPSLTTSLDATLQ